MHPPPVDEHDSEPALSALPFELDRTLAGGSGAAFRIYMKTTDLRPNFSFR